MKPFLSLSNLAVQSLAPCELPHPVRVEQFAQKFVELMFEKHYLVQLCFVFVIRWIFCPLGIPSLLLTWYFLFPKGWWNFPWLCQVLAVPGLLPCGLPSYARRWAICTTLCGIDLWKMLSCTSLIQYGSPEEYFGLDYSPCFSWICLINKSQLWVTLSVLY